MAAAAAGGATVRSANANLQVCHTLASQLQACTRVLLLHLTPLVVTLRLVLRLRDTVARRRVALAPAAAASVTVLSTAMNATPPTMQKVIATQTMP
eukprot:5403675-Pleurochrysis_carterae.AAC.1